MTICPRCNSFNSDSMRYCGYCGAALGIGSQQPGDQHAQQRLSQHLQPVQPRKSFIMLMIVILFIAIIVIAVIATYLALPRGVQIEHWDANGYNLVVVGNVRFSVTVTNYGSEVVTETILCAVVFENGDSYCKAKSVTLQPGETKVVEVDVIVTNFEHMDEINSESWTNATCVLIS